MSNEQRAASAIAALEDTIATIRSYLNNPTAANRRAAIESANETIALKDSDASQGFVWKQNASAKSALEHKVSLVFDDYGPHGKSLMSRLYAQSPLRENAAPEPKERGQSTNVDNLKRTIQDYDKDRASAQQLQRARDNAVAAYDGRFNENPAGWTRGLIDNYNSFVAQADRRLESPKVQRPQLPQGPLFDLNVPKQQEQPLFKTPESPLFTTPSTGAFGRPLPGTSASPSTVFTPTTPSTLFATNPSTGAPFLASVPKAPQEPKERGQSANVDSLRDTIRAYDKDRASTQQLKQARENAIAAFDGRFKENPLGWTQGLIANYESFVKQADTRIESPKVQKPQPGPLMQGPLFDLNVPKQSEQPILKTPDSPLFTTPSTGAFGRPLPTTPSAPSTVFTPTTPSTLFGTNPATGTPFLASVPKAYQPPSGGPKLDLPSPLFQPTPKQQPAPTTGGGLFSFSGIATPQPTAPNSIFKTEQSILFPNQPATGAFGRTPISFGGDSRPMGQLEASTYGSLNGALGAVSDLIIGAGATLQLAGEGYYSLANLGVEKLTGQSLPGAQAIKDKHDKLNEGFVDGVWRVSNEPQEVIKEPFKAVNKWLETGERLSTEGKFAEAAEHYARGFTSTALNVVPMAGDAAKAGAAAKTFLVSVGTQSPVVVAGNALKAAIQNPTSFRLATTAEINAAGALSAIKPDPLPSTAPQVRPPEIQRPAPSFNPLPEKPAVAAPTKPTPSYATIPPSKVEVPKPAFNTLPEKPSAPTKPAPISTLPPQTFEYRPGNAQLPPAKPIAVQAITRPVELPTPFNQPTPARPYTPPVKPDPVASAPYSVLKQPDGPTFKPTKPVEPARWEPTPPFARKEGPLTAEDFVLIQRRFSELTGEPVPLHGRKGGPLTVHELVKALAIDQAQKRQPVDKSLLGSFAPDQLKQQIPITASSPSIISAGAVQPPLYRSHINVSELIGPDGRVSLKPDGSLGGTGNLSHSRPAGTVPISDLKVGDSSSTKKVNSWIQFDYPTLDGISTSRNKDFAKGFNSDQPNTPQFLLTIDPNHPSMAGVSKADLSRWVNVDQGETILQKIPKEAVVKIEPINDAARSLMPDDWKVKNPDPLQALPRGEPMSAFPLKEGSLTDADWVHVQRRYSELTNSPVPIEGPKGVELTLKNMLQSLTDTGIDPKQLGTFTPEQLSQTVPRVHSSPSVVGAGELGTANQPDLYRKIAGAPNVNQLLDDAGFINIDPKTGHLRGSGNLTASQQPSGGLAVIKDLKIGDDASKETINKWVGYAAPSLEPGAVGVTRDGDFAKAFKLNSYSDGGPEFRITIRPDLMPGVAKADVSQWKVHGLQEFETVLSQLPKNAVVKVEPLNAAAETLMPQWWRDLKKAEGIETPKTPPEQRERASSDQAVPVAKAEPADSEGVRVKTYDGRYVQIALNPEGLATISANNQVIATLNLTENPLESAVKFAQLPGVLAGKGELDVSQPQVATGQALRREPDVSQSVPM